MFLRVYSISFVSILWSTWGLLGLTGAICGTILTLIAQSIWSNIVYLLKNDDLLLKMCIQHMVSEIKMMIAFILIISQISTSFWGTPGVKWGSKWGQKGQKLPVCLKIMTDCWKFVHNIWLAM